MCNAGNIRPPAHGRIIGWVTGCNSLRCAWRDAWGAALLLITPVPHTCHHPETLEQQLGIMPLLQLLNSLLVAILYQFIRSWQPLVALGLFDPC